MGFEEESGGATAHGWPEEPEGERGGSDETEYQGRLHPLTLVFTAWQAVRGFIIPLFLLLVMGHTGLLSGLFVFMVVLPVVLGMIRYFTFSYRLEGGDLVTLQGWVQRTERHIPLEKVQDLRLEQGLLHRWLRMAEVHVETAGGERAEAVLSVLSVREAQRLRRAVFHRKARKEGERVCGAETAVVLRQVGLRELVWAGMTSNHLASAMAMFAVGFGLIDDFIGEARLQEWVRQSAEWVGQRAGRETGAEWLLAVWGGTVVIGVGLLVSITGSVVLFHRFTLSRSGEDLHRSYGLLTRRFGSLPRRRVQVLKIEETFLRRLFHLATLRVDTAGGRRAGEADAKAGRDVLLPVIPRKEVAGLLPEIFPDLPEGGEDGWHPVAPCAVRRGTFKGVVICVLASSGLLALDTHWSGLWPLGLLPGIYLLNLLSYRHLGFQFAGGFFQSRRGWLGRAHHVVPVRNVQAVVLRSTPFDRRHSVWTLKLDTAGQAYTGGGPMLSNIPDEEARELAGRLAHQAGQLHYRS